MIDRELGGTAKRMMRAHWVLAVAGLLAVACDAKAPDEAGDGDETGDGDGDGDGDAPASCFDHADADACQAAECMWWPALRITTADEACTVEQYPMCIPGPSDGGDPACVSGIPGCGDPGSDPEGDEWQYAPAWVEHPDGGWVVIDLCGNLEYDSFTPCASGAGDAHPACNCACSS